MTVSDEIKTIHNKLEKIKAKFELDRQTANILALSSGNVGKYKFLTDEDVLPEKYLLEKAATVKNLEYLSLGYELKKQTDIAKNNTKD